MNIPQKALAASALSLLAGCMEPGATGASNGPGAGFVELPESVVALAAPSQNLQRVRVQPEDGCYWYEWVGPVETTYLPLRSRDGRPICTRPQTEEVVTEVTS